MIDRPFLQPSMDRGILLVPTAMLGEGMTGGIKT